MSKTKRVVKPNIVYFLLPIAVGLIVLSFAFRQNTNVQYLIILLSLIAYLLFSLIHHYFDKTLTFEVIIEYILIAVLVFLVLSSTTF